MKFPVSISRALSDILNCQFRAPSCFWEYSAQYNDTKVRQRGKAELMTDVEEEPWKHRLRFHNGRGAGYNANGSYVSR